MKWKLGLAVFVILMPLVLSYITSYILPAIDARCWECKALNFFYFSLNRWYHLMGWLIVSLLGAALEIKLKTWKNI